MKTKTAKDYLNEPYTFALIRDEDSGTFAVSVEEFEGCFSQGRTADEAMANIMVAAENWIEATLNHGKSIPPPLASIEASGKFAFRMPIHIHDKIQRLAIADKVSLNTFILEAVAEKIGAIEYHDRQMARLEARMAQQTVANLAAMLLPLTERPRRAATDQVTTEIDKLIEININH